MTKKLQLNLLFTFLLSTVLTGIAFSILYHKELMEARDGEATVIALVVATIAENVMIAFITLLILWQINETNYAVAKIKYSFLLAGPVLTTLFFAVYLLDRFGKDIFIIAIPGTLFFILHFLFFKKIQTKYAGKS